MRCSSAYGLIATNSFLLCAQSAAVRCSSLAERLATGAGSHRDCGPACGLSSTITSPGWMPASFGGTARLNAVHHHTCVPRARFSLRLNVGCEVSALQGRRGRNSCPHLSRLRRWPSCPWLLGNLIFSFGFAKSRSTSIATLWPTRHFGHANYAAWCCFRFPCRRAARMTSPVIDAALLSWTPHAARCNPPGRLCCMSRPNAWRSWRSIWMDTPR